MTTMRHDLDASLAALFEREATDDGAAAILESALGRTSRLRPRSAWIAALRESSVGTRVASGPTTRSRLGYALILAALLAALVVGALFLAGQRPPRISQPRACVGVDVALCGHTAGVWTSESFLPGLTLTWPNDGWYTRDLPGQLEVKTPPMTSAVIVHLDPLPAGRDPGNTGDVASLVRWLRDTPAVTIELVGKRMTRAGLSVTSFDIRSVDPRTTVALLVARANPTGAAIVETNHYAQRLHLVDLGGGHVLSILVIAYDSDPQTVRRTDATFAPILDSIHPPPSFQP